MEEDIYNPLQIREIFHIEFLRSFGRKVKPEYYCLKGGANIRLFFQSLRYSEDMDLDASNIGVSMLKDLTMQILQAKSFAESLRPFGIKSVVAPDIKKAKQTATTQRFKIHLITSSAEDLFTKIEFSRRGFKGNIVVGSASEVILRSYKLPPLLVPHYDVWSSAIQKISALAGRAVVQARDIFDLYILSTQVHRDAGTKFFKLASKEALTKAYENIFEIDFKVFKDTVVSYLSIEDQGIYENSSAWEEVRLKAAQFIEEMIKKYA